MTEPTVTDERPAWVPSETRETGVAGRSVALATALTWPSGL
jgi:hypothetical protein